MSTPDSLSTTALVLEADTAGLRQAVPSFVLELWLADQLTRSARHFASKVIRLDGHIRVWTGEAASGERTLIYGFTPTKKGEPSSQPLETTHG